MLYIVSQTSRLRPGGRAAFCDDTNIPIDDGEIQVSLVCYGLSTW